MFISHKTIVELLDPIPAVTKIHTMEYCLMGYEMLDDAVTPYFEHTLYVVRSPEELKSLVALPYMNLLILDSGDTDCEKLLKLQNNILNYTIIKTDDCIEVRRILRDFFDIKNGRGYLADSVLGHLFEEKGIQDMVNDFSDAFNNPIFVFDAGYRLVAATWEMALTHEGSRKMTETMRITDEDFAIINQHSPSNAEIMVSNEPSLVFHPEYGYQQLIVSIDPHNPLGCIVVNEVNRKFRDIDRNLLKMLRDGVCQKMRMDSFIRNNNGYPYEYFVRDLLDRKIEISDTITSRYEYVNNEFSNNMYCMVVEIAKSATVLDRHLLREQIKGLFENVKVVMYNGELVAVISLLEKQQLTKSDRNRIRALCRETQIFAGLSNRFESIFQIFDYYKQALRATELGITVNELPDLFEYSEYGREHVNSVFATQENIKAFCHPVMKELGKYDLENNTQLAYSLYMYLLYERNSAAAAKAMFVHRNTLIYRLQKIDDLVEIDYECPKERQYLITSYELIHFHANEDLGDNK